MGLPTTDSSSAGSPVGDSTPLRCLTPQQKQQQQQQQHSHNAAAPTSSKRKKPRRKYPNSSSTVRTLLQQTAGMEGMDFLKPEPCRPLVDDSTCSLTLLERRVESLYLESDSVYRPEMMQSISVQAMEKHSESLGKTVEIMSTTPMMCPLKEASDMLWKWFSLSKVCALL